MRLAIVLTHPVQYYAPVFQLLTARGVIQAKVFYTRGNMPAQFDPGFKQNVEWDIPLLTGYDYEWVENTAKDPGSHHFSGIKNPQLISGIQAFQPDAVLIYGWAYHSHLQVLRKFKGRLPVIFRGDSTLLDEQGPIKKSLRTALLKWVYRHIDFALYHGTSNKAYFEKYSVKEHQLIFAPHAVDNERFSRPRTAEVAALRNKLKVDENHLLILFAGKFESKKDPLLLLDAFSRIKNPEIHLLFTGDGELKNELIQQAATIANVHFLGFTNQSELPVVYQSCDLFCLPSKGPGETWGLAVNEAMACEKAILASDKVGCAADLVQPSINGAVFKSGDISDLANKLVNLTSSSERLDQYGHQSAEIIKNWNFIAVASSIEALLKQITSP